MVSTKKSGSPPLKWPKFTTKGMWPMISGGTLLSARRGASSTSGILKFRPSNSAQAAEQGVHRLCTSMVFGSTFKEEQAKFAPRLS